MDLLKCNGEQQSSASPGRVREALAKGKGVVREAAGSSGQASPCLPWRAPK